MSDIDLARIARAYVAAGNARDYAALDALRTADFVAHVPIGGAIEDADPILAETLNRDLAMVVGAFPDLVSEEQDLIAAGDRVVVRARLSGTHSGSLGGIPATGETIAWDTVHIYRVEGGKIAEAWFVTDTLGLLRQAGAVEIKATCVDEA